MKIIKVFRPINLLIVGFTMYAMRFWIMEPFLLNRDYHLVFSPFDFFLLVLSTLLIAAGGYIINDYFDIRADRINKPEKVIVGKYVKRRVAMLTHSVFNIIAVGIAIYLWIKTGSFWPLIFHIGSTTMLWLYSLSWKRKALIGNIAIAVLSAAVPMLVGLAELPLVVAKYGSIPNIHCEVLGLSDCSVPLKQIYLTLMGFALFAFLLTIVREIQKDMADIEGDQTVGCNTFPISNGLKSAKLLSVLIMAITVVTGYVILSTYFNFFQVHMFVITTIVTPALASVILTIKGNNRRQFLLASSMIKITMLSGILFSLIINQLLMN